MRTCFLVPFSSPSARKIVAVFHHAGGSGLSFLRLAKRLAPEFELRLAEIPGRGASVGQPLPKSLSDFASAAAAEIEGWEDRPLVLYGHSMGGLVAYEVALRLPPNCAPEKLIVSACRNPGSRHEISDLSDEALLRTASMYGSPTQELSSKEVQAYFLSQLRADLKLLGEYEPTRQLIPVPLLVLGGEEDPVVKAADLEGWRPYTQKGFEIRLVPGGHFFPFENPAIFDHIF
jgi:pyochelin biosynthesis protein PchC